MHTGVVPLDGNFDIDVGLIFDCDQNKYPDPVALKKKVRDAANSNFRTVVIRRPCVTVNYMSGGKIAYHVDLANRSIIRKEAHVQQFRNSFNAFLQQLFAAGARVLHIHPATPLSASIEIGRTLLPKAFEEVHVWEWQAPYWKPTLRLK